MITVVTLNPCIDKTLTLESFTPGATNRVIGLRTDIGGKGINVSAVLSNLGISSKNILFDYTRCNISVSDFLAEKGINFVAIPVEAELRTNLKIYDKLSGTMTEINEPGAQISSEKMTEFFEKFKGLLASTDVLVLCGSVPAGVSAGIYRTIIEQANKQNVKTILDASGEAFLLGVHAAPTLVKPNIQELSEYTNSRIETEEDILSSAKKLLEKGIEYVCVSAGENGAYLCTRSGNYFTSGAAIPVRGLQGAGDSMVAMFSNSLCESLAPDEMLRRAVAAAQATVMQNGTELCRKDDYFNLYQKIKVKALN